MIFKPKKPLKMNPNSNVRYDKDNAKVQPAVKLEVHINSPKVHTNKESLFERRKSHIL